MYTKKEIKEQLNTFQKALGHHVHIHSSLKSVGEVEGNGEGLLEMLVSYFTQGNGMVSFPTHTWAKNRLDLRVHETCTGMLGKLALQREDGIRSKHTTHSMVVFGEGAAEYVKLDESAITSTSPDGCYGKLYDTEGYILLIGVNQNKNTFIHTVEEALQLPNRVTKERHNTILVNEDGTEMIWPMHLVFEEYGDISQHFQKLEPAFQYHGALIKGRIGDADATLCNARCMREVITLIHQRSHNVELFLDDKPLQEEWYKG